jgi:hypothetical protein
MTFHIACLGLLSLSISVCTQAQPWEFAEPVIVSGSEQGRFHHLESSGRRNIAVSVATVAVAWEDDRDGTPRVYLARKGRNGKAFSPELRISGDGEAYEPSLVALDNNRFVLAWEEDARIHLRMVTPTGPGPVVIASAGEATQPGLARHGQQLLLVYSRRDGRYGRVYIQNIKIDGPALQPMEACAVDAEPAQDDQLYPTLVSVENRTIVAWEDRRPGHTIIMAAQNDQPDSCGFTPPQRISEAVDGLNVSYGKGHGVARVALGSYGDGQVLAAWADKRDFREGYDIYAAHYQPGSKQLFGPNGKVQDSFGGVAQQWHATVAGDASGRLVAAWDDKRDGDADIMLSWLEDGDWSDDIAVPGASGAGEQNHPSITLDPQGDLHLAWIERATVDGPTRVRYVSGRLIER